MPQPLPPKEQAHFRSVIRYYEEKQYKRGLKTADLILKKIPRHGDTMAMKALIMNAQGKTEEAFSLGKEALTVDMKSHICWHVYGLLYRANKNFEEAIKAYKFALKLEPESAQILRDLAILQVQMRDYAGYIQSRTAMLQARPQLRQNWTALAIAHHLSGNLGEAENVLTTYEGTLKATPSKFDLEHSESVLYKNSIVAEQGDYQRALDHLEDAAKANLDRLAVLEARALYHKRLGNKEEAVKACRALLSRNSERAEYYERLLEAMEVPSDDLQAKKAVYEEYAKASLRCDAARRIPLNFLTGDDFKQAAETYLNLMLDKGVPSTFANLKNLYSDDFKKQSLAGIAKKYLESDIDSSSKDKGEAAALFYLAQHYNYYQSRDLSVAEEYINKAIEKDSQSVDFHMTKARILKHGGNLQKASEMMDYARKLDLKDRYINSKAAKYQLRNDESETALQTVGLFTRAETPGGPLADLLDMQSIWFLSEDGESYARQGNIGLALKRLRAVLNIFDVWQEDQFDFHSFSLRKGQVRAYIDMIRWEDHLRDHPFYSRAAIAAVQIYLALANRPSANGLNGNSGADGEDALAKKKAAKKARKEQQKLERETAEKQARQDPNKGKPQTGEDLKKTDDDPLGLKLAATDDPLGEAAKITAQLLHSSPKSLEAQMVGFDVYMQRNKHVLALRCLNSALSIDPSHPRLHEQAVRLRAAVNTAKDLPSKVFEVLETEFKAIPASTDLDSFNEEYLAKHTEPLNTLYAIKARRALGKDKANCEGEVVGLMHHDGLQWPEALEALKTLRQWRSGKAEEFEAAAKSKWPEVTRFS